MPRTNMLRNNILEMRREARNARPQTTTAPATQLFPSAVISTNLARQFPLWNRFSLCKNWSAHQRPVPIRPASRCRRMFQRLLRLLLVLALPYCFAQSTVCQSAPSSTASTSSGPASPSSTATPVSDVAKTSSPPPAASLSLPPNPLGDAVALYRKGDFDGA